MKERKEWGSAQMGVGAELESLALSWRGCVRSLLGTGYGFLKQSKVSSSVFTGVHDSSSMSSAPHAPSGSHAHSLHARSHASHDWTADRLFEAAPESRSSHNYRSVSRIATHSRRRRSPVFTEETVQSAAACIDAPLGNSSERPERTAAVASLG